MTSAPFGLAPPRLMRLAPPGARRTPARLWLGMASFTAFRLLLIPPIALSFLNAPTITFLALGAFMVIDLFDGVLARRFEVDDARRRALDSVVDRIAIDSCLVAACVAHAIPAWLLAGFLGRDAYCAALCATMFVRSGAAVKADLVYRGLNCMIALWALAAPFVSPGVREIWIAALAACAVVVAADLTRCVGTVLQLPDAHGAVIRASFARRGLGRAQSTGFDRSATAPRST